MDGGSHPIRSESKRAGQSWNSSYLMQWYLTNIHVLNWLKKIICIPAVSIYTSRKSVYLRLLNNLGNPHKLFYTNKKISGAIWKVNFTNKKMINYTLSRPILIGNIK